MKWDYAELSKTAKSFGGPEMYVNMIETLAKRSGRLQMVPMIPVVLAVGSVATYFIIKYVDKKKELETQTAAIKEELTEILDRYQDDSLEGVGREGNETEDTE